MEGFLDLQLEIYETYRKLQKADKNEFDNLLSKLRSQKSMQSEYLNNITFRRDYPDLIEKFSFVSESITTNSLYNNMEELSEKDINDSILYQTLNDRIFNLHEFNKFGKNKKKFENVIIKKVFNILKNDINSEKDEKRKEILKQIAFNIIFCIPFLEKKFLINPEFISLEKEDSSPVDSELINSQKDDIKTRLISLIDNFLSLNLNYNRYITYISAYIKVFIKSYVSFLNRNDLNEIEKEIKEIINKYIGAIPQRKIDEILNIINHKPKTNTMLRVIRTNKSF